MGFLGLLAAGRSAARDKSDKENALQQAQQFQAIKFGQDRELAQSQIAENNARTDALRNPPVKPTPPRIQLEAREDGTYLVNLDTGEANKINVPGVKKTVQPHNIDPLSSEGIAAQMRINAAKPASTAGSQPSESERRAAGLLTEMIPAAKVVKQYSPHVSGLDAMLPGPVANFANRNKPEVQKALQAAQDLVSTYLYAISGATVTPDEARKRAQLILPGPSDSAELKKQKAETVDRMIEAVRTLSGRAAPAGNTPPAKTGGPSGDINLGGSSRAQQLWDEAVKLHGEAKVLAEFGPRPKE